MLLSYLHILWNKLKMILWKFDDPNMFIQNLFSALLQYNYSFTGVVLNLIWCVFVCILLLLLLLIWQSPGLPGWRKVNLITVTRRPLHPSIAAGFYCLTTSPGFLPALCEKWSGFFYVHRVWLSYTRDRRLKVSSERLGNEDKAPCPRALLPGSNVAISHLVLNWVFFLQMLQCKSF